MSYSGLIGEIAVFQGGLTDSPLMSLLVYRLVHAPVTRESWVRLPGRELFLDCVRLTHGVRTTLATLSTDAVPQFID